MENSRTKKGLLNASITFIFYFIILVLNFFSRKVFIQDLGAELLGLNTTLTNLLSFLNLAELGIGSAVAFSLYTPLFNKDQKDIVNIVSVQGYWYRKIGYFVLTGGLILMMFFPYIFEKVQLADWYIYTTFSVLLLSSILGYFWNYKQILLSADQKQYKVTANRQSWMAIKILLQIFAISYLEHGYIYWLVFESIFSILMVLSLNRIINKEYPWLKCNIKQGKMLQKQYSEIVRKVKQLFFHRIGGFVLTQLTPIIIFAYASLTLVAIYGNYMLIVMGISTMLGAIFNGLTGSIGNLVAQGDSKQIVKVFWELFSVRFILVSVACIGVLILATPFVSLWVGDEYSLDNITLTLIVLIMFINTMRTVVDSFISAYGLFSDIWATIAESVMNISLSIIFGYLWGLNGILIGVLISIFLMVFIWKPYFCFSRGFNIPFTTYIKTYGKFLLSFFFLIFLTYSLTSSIHINPATSYYHWLIYAIILLTTFLIAISLLMYCISQGMRSFLKRLFVLIKTR